MTQTDELFKPSEDRYLNCIRCGSCIAVCPTYREHLNEISSPRGRVALARKCLEGDLELSPNLIEQMYACLDCLACSDICPVGIKPADLTLAMRAFQEQRHPKHWKEMLFAGFVSQPGRLETATLPLRFIERSGLRCIFHSIGLGKVMPKKLRDLEAMIPRQSRRPLRQILPQVTLPHGESRFRVGFFLGCAQSLMFADQSAASLRVLARNSCTVFTPKETVCCGMPALGYGLPNLVRDQARHNIELFDKANVEFIITDCATCGSTLKEYGDILASDPCWAERAAAFSARVRDINEFLISIPLVKPAGSLSGRITYHDPCHLRRGQGVWEQPREILKTIDGLEFIESPEADWCCGSAGSQLITHYQTSRAVLGRKVENLIATKAAYVASGCPACQMQLTAGLKHWEAQMLVLHPVTLLDEAYNNRKAYD